MEYNSAIFKAQRLTADLTNKIILKIDFRNAFNSINRRLCLKTMGIVVFAVAFLRRL